MERQRAGPRGRPARPVAWLAVLLALPALVLSYLGRAILQAESFADHAAQRRRIRRCRQRLDDGIRGLLIDTYCEFPARGMRTDLSSLPIDEEAVKTAERIRSRLGDQNLGGRQIYVCHGFCELGAVPLSDTLAERRTYLVSNPGEVVIVINQDEGVALADIERAFASPGCSTSCIAAHSDPFPPSGS